LLKDVARIEFGPDERRDRLPLADVTGEPDDFRPRLLPNFLGDRVAELLLTAAHDDGRAGSSETASHRVWAFGVVEERFKLG